MMRKIKLNGLFFGLIFIASNAFAWGPTGHQIVAEIAKQYLTKNVKDSVDKYLNGLSFEETATWMDDIKKEHLHDNMNVWHYINIEKDKTYVKTNEENVVNELQKAISQLSNKKQLTKDEINFNLKVVFHLVGDLHQPLHTGYASDRGGNTDKYDFMGKEKNLHHIWDMDIIEHENITTADCIKIISKLSATQIKEIEKMDVVTWMNQSRAFLPDVYNIQNGTITEAYIKKNAAIIKMQLANAGLRLAAVLNETFKK
ncbi:MAG: S1/P1 nuclease [Bacteroidia bacterium]